MATKYKRYSRGGRFKGTDIGDAGISALRRRDAQIVENIERQRRQHEEISRDQLGGMERAFRLEADNVAQLQALEDKIYANKRNDIKLRGQREVEALEGKAKEYGRQAEHWKELTPKLGKSLQQLSEGFGHVANKLAYDKARENALEKGFSTLDMWGILTDEHYRVTTNVEEGANKADDLLRKQIENGEFSQGQELALDSTGVYWKNGRVHYLAKSLTKDINSHFDEGMRAYSEIHGPPKTAADYERAAQWVLKTIENNYGLTNSNFNSSVQEFRKKFKEIAGANGYNFTKARNTQISITKINESNTIFQANPTEKNLHRLIWTTRRFGGQKNDTGTYIPHTDQSAIRQLVGIWAADIRNVNDDELLRRLGMLTPEDGRQEGDAGNGYNKSQLAGRDQGLYQYAIDIRAKAKRNKINALSASETSAKNEATADTFNWALGLGEYAEGGNKEGQAFDGSTEQMETKLKELELIAPEAAKKYKPFLMKLTNSGYNLSLMKDEASNLIKNGKYVEALNYISFNPIFSQDEKKDLLNQIPFVIDLGGMGIEQKEMNKSIEAELKYALGWEGNKVFYDPSVKWASNKALAFLHARYIHYKGMDESKSNAYNLAWGDLKESIKAGMEGKGVFAVKQRSNGTKYFKDFSDEGSVTEEDAKVFSPSQLQTILNSNDLNGAAYLLDTAIKGGTEDRNIFSSRVINNWVEEFSTNGTLTSNALIDKIARDLPRNHALYRNKAGIIKLILSERANKDTQALAKTITDDTKIVVSKGITGLPNYQSFAERIKTARSSDEVKAILNIYQHTVTNNKLPIKNTVREKLSSSNYLDAFLTNYAGGRFKGVKVIPSPVQRNKTETYNEFKLGTQEATTALIQNAYSYGFAYDTKTKTFYEID